MAAPTAGDILTAFVNGAENATLATAIAAFETAYGAIQTYNGTAPQILWSGIAVRTDAAGAIAAYQPWAIVQYMYGTTAQQTGTGATVATFVAGSDTTLALAKTAYDTALAAVSTYNDVQPQILQSNVELVCVAASGNLANALVYSLVTYPDA